VLDAMGVPEWRSVSALRLSYGPHTTEAEIDRGCRAIREAALALQSSCLLNTVGGFDAPEQLRDGVVQLRVGPTNSWIVADREAKTCVVIDPCETVAERIEGYVRCQGLRVLAVVDTHSHADHESIRPLLQKVLSDCMAEQGAECDALGWPRKGTDAVTLADGTRAEGVRLGTDRVLARVATPGHTDDSHALILMQKGSPEFAFCGDTILSGGLGRTNFVMSDPEALFHSLAKLGKWLSGRTLLCPAHDYDNSFATTLDAEKSGNELLRLVGTANVGLFVEKKREVDSRLEAIEKQFKGIVCGVSEKTVAVDDRDLVLAADKVRAGGYQVIDVREPHESTLYRQWGGLGLSESPRNVPLSRFVNYMRELVDAGEAAPAIVLVCRSGNRSLQAAKTLRRMGLRKVWSLQGGVALL
jgi:glyoxylase-like metal-dependent hydrolase (beta-lactamase superfamily II)/rhodanese-related sulfurtransferase